MPLPLVCPCLPENMRRNCFVTRLCCNFLQNEFCQNNSFVKYFWGIILATMVVPDCHLRWSQVGRVSTFQTCLALKRASQPGTKYVFKHFREKRGCPWYGPFTHPRRHFSIRTLRYQRAFGAGTRYASLDIFLGILEASAGTRVAPVTVPLRNPKGTSQKACLENPET